MFPQQCFRNNVSSFAGALNVSPFALRRHHVLRIISCVISARTSARTVQTKVSFEDKLAQSIRDCILLNEHGHLSFFRIILAF